MTGVGGAVDNMKRNNMNSLDFAREYRKKDQKSLFSGGDWGGGGRNPLTLQNGRTGSREAHLPGLRSALHACSSGSSSGSSRRTGITQNVPMMEIALWHMHNTLQVTQHSPLFGGLTDEDR